VTAAGPPGAPRTRDDEAMEHSAAAVVSYVERAIDAMADILAGLGGELANRRPDLPGANSPYVILRHCLGVMEYWGGHVVAGRDVERDRPAEFRASGPVASLIEAAERAKERFRADAATAEPTSPPRRISPGEDPAELELASQLHTLLHVMEEVFQHLGQMEITRDVLSRR
jgi:hypothetical protein